jgi:hypothetical protein
MGVTFKHTWHTFGMIWQLCVTMRVTSCACASTPPTILWVLLVWLQFAEPACALGLQGAVGTAVTVAVEQGYTADQ